MGVHKENYQSILAELGEEITLVAVSKTKPVEDIQALYDLGQRDFGENYVQELVEKKDQLPADIHWHYIGHLQSNKVKFIAPFVHLIHGIDSLKLLKEVNKQGAKLGRVIPVLLQIHISTEETKFGLNEEELNEVLISLNEMEFVEVRGLMGMASFSDDKELVTREFHYLKSLFDQHKEQWKSPATLSMGMSGDYKLAVKQGTNMVRIGSLLFGARK